MIYGIAENLRPLGKCVKYAPAAWGLIPALILLLGSMHLAQPVPNKGDHSNPHNNRPLALILAIAKVFETLLNSYFIKHLESNDLLLDDSMASVRQDIQGIFLCKKMASFPILKRCVFYHICMEVKENAHQLILLWCPRIPPTMQGLETLNIFVCT